MKKNARKRKMNKNTKILILCLVGIIILIVLILGISKIINVFNSNDNKEPTNVVQKIDQMENYDYYLDENATDYYKELYDELKVVLNAEEVNNEDYAKVIAKLFVADLFTLDNKMTSSDIGGLQFVYTDFKEDFVNIAKTSLYSSVKSNIYGDRNQELPIVSNVEINSISSSSFNYESNEYDSYDVSLNITYQKDLGYPTKYSLSLIWNDKYLQVAKAE